MKNTESPFGLSEHLGLVAGAMSALAESLDRFAEESWDHPEAVPFFEECLTGLTFLDAFVEARILYATPFSPIDTEAVSDSFASENGWLRVAALRARVTFHDETLENSLSVLADTLDDLVEYLRNRDLRPPFNEVNPETALVA
ncbi:MAG: hypothetical protein P1U85_08520 [Verrucomicrobiales bacterium]|nr:hypothetical protein [Verrucomicrobiales bacterium]